MNRKQSKSLRKIAKRLSDKPTSYFTHPNTKMVLLEQDCQRFYYQQLKNQYKSGYSV